MSFPYVDVAQLALTPLRDLGVEAYVCGGFLRDAWLGIEPKDIDVFVFAPRGRNERGWVEPLKALEALVTRLADHGFPMKPIDNDFVYPMEEGGTEVVAAVEADRTVFGLPVQLIMVDGFEKNTILERFDYGVCRAMTDGTTVWLHPHFIEDMTARQFRLRRERESLCLMSSVERYARFKQRPKFAEWTFSAYTGSGDFWDFNEDGNTVSYDPMKSTPVSVPGGVFLPPTRDRHHYEPVRSPYVYEERRLADLPGVSL